MPSAPSPELAGFLRRHALRVLVQAVVVGAAAGLLSLLIPNKFTASTVMLPPNPQADLGGLLSGAAGGMAISRALGIDAQNEIDVYLGVLRSDHVNQRLVERFDLQKLYRQKDAEKAGKRLKSHTGISLTNEGFVKVAVTEPDRKLAADLANAYAEELDQFLRLNTNTSARLRREFMDQRLTETEGALAASEDSLRDYQTRSNLPLLGTESQAASSAAGELLAQKVQREIELGTLRKVSTGTNPRIEQLQEEVDQIDRQLSRIPPATTEIARLLRNAKIQERILLVLTEERERARLLELKTMGSVEVVDRAGPPLHKSQPHRTLIAGAAFGLALLAGFALARLREPAPIER
jgi:tyrosine-protein kinase Etk/Wzc